MRRKKRLGFFFALFILFGVVSGGCSAEPVSRTMFMLDTVVTITVYGGKYEEALDEAFEICSKYEKMFSRTYQGGELYEFNRAAQTKPVRIKVSDELAYLVEKSFYFNEISGGLFDITIGAVSSLWDFKAQNPAPPDKNLINSRLSFVGAQNLSVENGMLCTAKAGVCLDFGAIAKGYIADKIKQRFIGAGVKSAVIDLGGNVVCLGAKPGGAPFQIGVQKPFAPAAELLATLRIKDKSVVTSGNYERYFNYNGILYHHILDPKTGFPADSELNAVTIISGDSTTGEGFSTACFALGFDKGLALVDSTDGVYAIFILKDGRAVKSAGFDEAVQSAAIQ